MGIETAMIYTTLSRNLSIQTFGYVCREVKRREGKVGRYGKVGYHLYSEITKEAKYKILETNVRINRIASSSGIE